MTTRLLTLRDRLEAAEARLDALKRRCSTGYACGSACISLRKECRSQGGAGSRERIQRLEQLARGEIKPRGLGVPKAADAKAMAKKLRAELNEQQALLKAERKRQQAAAEAAGVKKPKRSNVDQVPALSQSLLRNISANDVRFDIQQDSRAQARVYEERGYNAKPEIVPTRRDLAQRTDLLARPSGRQVILVRGMSADTRNYVDEFKRGDQHWVGFGMYGNGTYAAAGSEAHSIAFEYTDLNSYGLAKDKHGPRLNEEANKRVVAFGLKKTARVVQCSTMEEFETFQKETIAKATDLIRAAGNANGQIGDLGLAAAMLGIDAYALPAPSHFRNGNQYWVVLNRGAVVVAEDGQWT